MFSEETIKVPTHDFDVTLIFPSGKKIVIQARPSNADVNYNGSLDICLPEKQAVTNWGDDMANASQVGRHPHIRKALQLVMELP